MKTFFLTQPDLIKFLSSMPGKGWELFAPFRVMDSIRLERINDASRLGEIVFDGVRADQPMKSFFFYTKETVASLPRSAVNPQKPVKRLIVGAKGCDLHALKVFDKAYLEEGIVPEPFYQERRQSTYIISSDCGYYLDSCFCALLGSKPYPVDGFDLNLSSTDGGFVMDVGSDKGDELIEEMGRSGVSISEVLSQQIDARNRKRDELAKRLAEANKEFEVPKKLNDLCRLAFDSEVWKGLADEKCVQCNGCLHTCPTCYCFLLYDTKKQSISERVRIWDACINSGYGRVAGGANPRPTLQTRLRHRFFHKFLYFFDLFGMFACSGCGRCFGVCPGKIEIRDTFKQISSKVKAQS